MQVSFSRFIRERIQGRKDSTGKWFVSLFATREDTFAARALNGDRAVAAALCAQGSMMRNWLRKWWFFESSEDAAWLIERYTHRVITETVRAISISSLKDAWETIFQISLIIIFLSSNDRYGITLGYLK